MTTNIPAVWDMVPGGSRVDLLDFVQSDPSAGSAGPILSLDGGYYWALLWCSFRFQTSVAAANRLPQVIFGTITLTRNLLFSANAFVPGSSTVNVICCDSNSVGLAAGNALSIPTSVLPVRAPGSWQVLVQTIQAGDQLSLISGTFLRWTV